MRTVLTQPPRRRNPPGRRTGVGRPGRGRPPAAAPVGPEVHKMVILNGPTYTAHYFSAGLSDSDQAALRDLETRRKQRRLRPGPAILRRQYVAQELAQSANRAAVQQALYGRSVTRSL